MNFLLRLLDVGIDVVDLRPRHWGSRIFIVGVTSAFLFYPTLLRQLGELRARPIVESVVRIAEGNTNQLD